jgi:hypothetical protein
MKNIKLIILLCISLLGIKASAQNEKIAIVILKGIAIVENSSSHIELKKSDRIYLNKNDNVKLFPNSVAIAYNKKVKIEFGGNKEQKLSFLQLSNSLKKIKPTSLTSNFIAYLEKMYVDYEEKNNTYGASIGAASRGVEDNSFNYLPNDESIILSDTLLLIFATEAAKLASNILVTNEKTNEQVFNNRPQGNDVILVGLKPGNYTWNYKIESNEKSITFSNTFIIPSSNEKEAKLKEIVNFKANLNDCATSETCLSDETKELLLNDFLEKNKYYVITK